MRSHNALAPAAVLLLTASGWFGLDLAAAPDIAADPIVIPDCRVTVAERQDVPSQRDGILLFVGTEVKPGEKVPADRLLHIKTGNELKQFRRLCEGDVVEKDQLLGRIDDTAARDEMAIRDAKVDGAKADYEASVKTRDEAFQRYQTQVRLNTMGKQYASEEDVRAAKLTYDRYVYEVVGKQAAIAVAVNELNQAKSAVRMHELRSDIRGVVKTIYKQRGDAVRALETVLRIENTDRLRVEGRVAVEYLPQLHRGMQVTIEVAQAVRPLQTLLGSRLYVSGVAVSKDARQIVASSGDDTVRVWERTSRQERRQLPHPASVRAVACTPPAAAADLCLTGGGDGVARLWDLTRDDDRPLRESKRLHTTAITSVAFSPDGNAFATGGQDGLICLWETPTGALKYSLPPEKHELGELPPGHSGAVKSLQFLGTTRLMAGDDFRLRVWALEATSARLERTERRSGSVPLLGASPDGQRLLLDTSNELQLLDLTRGTIEAVLRDPGGPLTTLALFSPDGRLVLTASHGGAGLQLWRLPTAATRGYKIRRLNPPEQTVITRAAFAPDGSFVVSGDNKGQVCLWPMPTKEEVEQPLTATVTLLEHSVEAGARQVRIGAELANPGGKLIPGMTVTLVVYPGKQPAGAPAGGASGPPPAAEARPDAAALPARVNAARRAYEGYEQQFVLGQVTFHQVAEWSRRWLEAEREQGGREQQVAAYEAHLARMKRLEDRMKAATQANAADKSAAEFYRLEAEGWLQRAKGKE
jgi:multidrug efflux pump subunit AcrA (membrane-fusion protein)